MNVLDPRQNPKSLFGVARTTTRTMARTKGSSDSHASDAKDSRKGASRNGVRPMGGDAWEIRYIAGQDVLSGKPLRRSETFHGGYRGAVKRRSELIADAQKGQGAGPRSTVDALLDAWLARNEERRANGDLAENTLASYRYQVKRLKELAPAFLTLRLDRLETAEPVEDLFAPCGSLGSRQLGSCRPTKPYEPHSSGVSGEDGSSGIPPST